MRPLTESEGRAAVDPYGGYDEAPPPPLKPRVGLSHGEIADALGISRQAVQAIERRAIFKLRRNLGLVNGGVK